MSKIERPPFDAMQLQAWLEPLADAAQVECDGMTRIIAHLLDKNGIQHVVAGGLLKDLQRIRDPLVAPDEKCGVNHWWIELGFDYIVDFRARMWMGPEAEHGVFIPSGKRFDYRIHDLGKFNPIPEPALGVMAGVSVGGWPPFIPIEAQERTISHV